MVPSTWNLYATTVYSLDKTDNTTDCTTSSTSDCDSYTTPRMKCSTTYGAWHNYTAATAGTITGDSNTTDATKDICPAGWRLPTYSEALYINDGTYTYVSIFNSIVGGRYTGGKNTDD